MNSTPGLAVALTDPDAKSRANPKWAEMCHVSIAFPQSVVLIIARAFKISHSKWHSGSALSPSQTRDATI